jgi:octaprenyl-diphosphate synthase
MPGLIEFAPVHQPLAGLLSDQLGEVTLIFERQLASDLSAVNSLCLHVEQYRGKMLRPTMLLLSGLAARGGNADPAALTDRHRTVGAVVEMIHMATLVHDDVLDEAEVRRRGATLNSLRGNEAAVMLGDYLISNAFHLCSTIRDPSINLALGEVTNTICAGELLQLHHRDDFSIDEATYFEIIRRKTASLIGECARLGARLSGAGPEIAAALGRIGQLLGMAFQIQDDLLDLTGEPAVVGKSLGRDLAKGKLTLPVIRHLATVDPLGRGRTLRLLERRDALSLRGCLLEGGAVESTHRTATDLVRQAQTEISRLPAGSAANALHSLAEAVITRSH